MIETTMYIGGVYAKDTEKFILIEISEEKNFCKFISFSGNLMVVAKIKNENERHICNCSDDDDIDVPNPNCEICDRKGIYILPSKILYSHFTLIASSMRSYLIQKFVD